MSDNSILIYSDCEVVSVKLSGVFEIQGPLSRHEGLTALEFVIVHQASKVHSEDQVERAKQYGNSIGVLGVLPIVY